MTASPAPLRILLNSLCFVLTVLLARWVLAGVIAAAPAEEPDNLTYFLRHKDEFDVVFAGSSLVGFMLDPVAFDEEMAKLGYPVRSFNIGRGGATAHETQYRIRQMLQASPQRLRILVIDCVPFEFTCEESRRDTREFVEWHDWRQTWRVVQSLLRAETPSREDKWSYLKLHLGAMHQRYSLRGSAPRVMEAWRLRRSVDPEAAEAELRRRYEDSQGYQSITQLGEVGFGALLEAQHERFRTDPREYDRLLNAHRAFLASPINAPAAAYDTASLIDQRRMLLDRGILPILLVAPSFIPPADYPRWLSREAGITNVILMDDPMQYPELYAHGARHDRNHLNDAAAPLYARLVARRVAQILDQSTEAVLATDPR